MANILNTDKQIAVISALAEGSSIRAIERITRRTVTAARKTRKPGRPKLPKGEAKGSIMPIRFSPEERKRVEAAARASGQTVSEWVRSTLAAAIGG
jgi:hypothetical protein